MAVTPEAFHLLIKMLEKLMPLSVLVKQRMMGMIISELHEKGTRILYQREVQNKIWFIVRGSAREYRDDLGAGLHEKTTWFWFATDIIYTVPGFFGQNPVQSSIELLEDSHLLYLNIDDYLYLKNETTILFEKIRDHCESLRLAHWQNNIHLNGKQKYLQLFQLHPNLFIYAKQKDIANFLGITPDTLSKLRKDN